MKPNFSRQFTELQKEVIGRLAQIEQEDADACAGCGGEDCVCCEIYQDRKLWVSPEELFADDDEEYFRYDEEEDEEELLSTTYDPDDFDEDEDEEEQYSDYSMRNSVRTEDLTGESEHGDGRYEY